jgi:hypothetical protein
MQILILFSHRICISHFLHIFSFFALFPHFSHIFFALLTNFWCTNCETWRKKCENAKKCEKCDANAKCKCDAKAVGCDAMGLPKSAIANAKNFSHYHPWFWELLELTTKRLFMVYIIGVPGLI